MYDGNGKPGRGCGPILRPSCLIPPKTDVDSVAVFQIDTPNAYGMHVLRVPKESADHDDAYRALDTCFNMNIFIEKAE